MAQQCTAILLGTRAEVLKCVPLLTRLRDSTVEHRVILSMQNEVDDLFEQFNLSKDNLVKLRGFESVGFDILKGTIRMPSVIAEIRNAIGESGCKRVLFHGDTATTVATALAARNSGNISMHLEAGFRSGSVFEPIPEELFRRVSDHLSQVLFAPSPKAVRNLKSERVKGEIIYTGNTIVDLVELALARVARDERNPPFIVATCHRYENIFRRDRLERVIKILSIPNLPVLWVAHPITVTQLKRFGLMKQVTGSNLKLVAPMPYLDFIKFVSRSTYVITDGGGLEQECLTMNKPCILLRKRTECGEGIELGMTVLTGLDPILAKKAFEKFESRPFLSFLKRNPLALRGSPSRILVEYLENI